MRKYERMMNLVKKFNGKVYLTEYPLKAVPQQFEDCTYFLMTTGTHIIVDAWRTQRDAIEGLSSIYNRGYIEHDGWRLNIK